jgi:hypothetical protein
VEHELLLIDTVAVIEAVRTRDFEEARFRCGQIEDRAWSENVSKVGNAAMNLEVALRHAETARTVQWGKALEELTSAVDASCSQSAIGYLLLSVRRAVSSWRSTL